MMSNNCPTCEAPAHYVADIAAPGFGQSWECDNGHPLLKVGNTLTDYKDLSPEDVVLDIDDVI